MLKIIAFCLLLMSCFSAGQVYKSDDLRVQRWTKAEVKSYKVNQVDRIVDRIITNKKRYVFVDNKTDVPWYIIAVLHNMESSGSFKHHLHEGSPLTGRTRWVPKGRPTWGKPPYAWEDSAKDALAYDNMGNVRWAYLFDTIWAIQRRGKYIADGKWSSTAISKQIGAAAIIKRMEHKGLIKFCRLK